MQQQHLVAMLHRHLVAAAARQKSHAPSGTTLYTQRKPIATHGDGLSSYVIGRVWQRRGEAFVGFDRLVCNTFFILYVTSVTQAVLQVLHRVHRKCCKGVPQARHVHTTGLSESLDYSDGETKEKSIWDDAW